jgi:hypothetical protein
VGGLAVADSTLAAGAGLARYRASGHKADIATNQKATTSSGIECQKLDCRSIDRFVVNKFVTIATHVTARSQKRARQAGVMELLQVCAAARPSPAFKTFTLHHHIDGKFDRRNLPGNFVWETAFGQRDMG